jgi:hypothetical protein
MITIYFLLACKDVRKRMLAFVLLLDRLMNCMHQVKLYVGALGVSRAAACVSLLYISLKFM